jgi:predicted PurR-regulated permease PerM
MGTAYEFHSGETVSPRAGSRSRRKPTLDRGLVERHVIFWVAALVLVVLALWLLSEILLPFIAGLAIAYLLTPVTDRLERIGVNRLAAALLIITVVVLALVYLILLVAPILRHATVFVYRKCARLRDEIAGAAKRPRPPLAAKVAGRWFQYR